MSEKVVDLGVERQRRRAARSDGSGSEPFPDPMSLATKIRIMKLARRDGFSFSEMMFATITVKYWACGGNKDGRTVLKRDWAMTVVNAMRRGWGVEGFEKWRKRNWRGMKEWMDVPMRALVLDDLILAIDQRHRRHFSFTPRTRTETICDDRLN